MGPKAKASVRAAAEVAAGVSPEALTWQFTLRCSRRYREWLTTVSDESMIPKASIARDALKVWAEQRGFPAPPCKE
jgi:hypothetical protein